MELFLTVYLVVSMLGFIGRLLAIGCDIFPIMVKRSDIVFKIIIVKIPFIVWAGYLLIK